MQIKYQQKSLLYEGKIRNHASVKKYVLETLPQLQGKNWVFTYIDAEGDQIILGDDDELFDNTIQFYDSCQKKIVLIIKLAWWKTVKVHSRSSLVKTLLSKKSERAYQPPSSDSDSSDDDYINIQFKPGEIFYQDSEMHSIPSSYEDRNSSTDNVLLLKKLDEKRKSLQSLKKNSEIKEKQQEKHQYQNATPSDKLENQAQIVTPIHSQSVPKLQNSTNTKTEIQQESTIK